MRVPGGYPSLPSRNGVGKVVARSFQEIACSGVWKSWSRTVPDCNYREGTTVYGDDLSAVYQLHGSDAVEVTKTERTRLRRFGIDGGSVSFRIVSRSITLKLCILCVYTYSRSSNEKFSTRYPNRDDVFDKSMPLVVISSLTPEIIMDNSYLYNAYICVYLKYNGTYDVH